MFDNRPQHTTENGVPSSTDADRGLVDAALNGSLPKRSTLDRLFDSLNLRLEPPTPADEFYPSREVYAQHAEPNILKATSFAPPRLYISGLAATTYHWRDIHERAHAAHGGHSEVHCLRGHDKGFFSMLDVSLDDWVKDVEERALRIRAETGRLPILHGHSTGALVALVAAARFAKEHPGEELCSGLILSAPAFELRQTMHRMGLIVARMLRKFWAEAEFWRGFAANMDGGGLDPDIPGKETPVARWLPVQMLLELEKLRPLAASLASSVHVPVLVIHGTNDVMANWKATASTFKRFPHGDRELVLVRNARHSMMFGPHAEEFEGTINKWIDSHRSDFDRRDERSLRAELIFRMRERWTIPPDAPMVPHPEQPTRRGWLFRWR